MKELDEFEGNKAIANYIGLKFRWVACNHYLDPPEYDLEIDVPEFFDLDLEYLFGLDEPERYLKFHENYQWQIKVVEWLETQNFGFKLCRKVVEVYWDDTKELILKTKGSSRTKSLFKALLEFIQWHKQHNLKKQ